MRKIFAIVFITLLSAGLKAQTAKYVVVVSVDGFRPDFYLDKSWPAPNMQQMMDKGIYAEGVRGIFPTVTYPSHTTLVTGVMPARHGIVYNTPFDMKGLSGRWFKEYKDIKAQTLWDAAHQAGLKTASVSWPVTVGATIDYNIPETWSEKTPGDRRGATSEDATPKGLFEEVQANATGHLEANDMDLHFLSMNENLGRMTAYLIMKYKPNLVTVHLPCTDEFEHMEGREGEGVRRAVASADRAIGGIIEALQKAGIKDSTALIITGDHGFVDTHSSLAPNVWLARQGLIGVTPDRGNWKAAFHSSGGSAFLHLKDPKDEKTLQQVKKILSELPFSEQKLFRIIDRATMDKMGSDPEAALALTGVQGISFNNNADGPVLRPAKGGAHGYFPDFKEIRTGFVAMGAGLNTGAVFPEIGLEDVAPLVAKLLGIELKQAEGIVYPGMLMTAKK
ncbi:Predicted pyrophosphatase or phosphodiesterase, AlkP superfamily [Chitinophaga sp. YR573]|uniref:alkaline phosphatase family protein n=1 Tax=Chitinophaga sp. YR573 TaxID=1881040 RepID=UPI0008D26EA6|nr:ectonucleotide pyrophosphatase/phosphodiesterase [Chitinophaga sp. YR573]SEW37470.1 Predicted pyrophosphatase or phosphodiesterase, AlkP superfamily [Chitinophaga sp. YR573]